MNTSLPRAIFSKWPSKWPSKGPTKWRRRGEAWRRRARSRAYA